MPWFPAALVQRSSSPRPSAPSVPESGIGFGGNPRGSGPMARALEGSTGAGESGKDARPARWDLM